MPTDTDTGVLDAPADTAADSAAAADAADTSVVGAGADGADTGSDDAGADAGAADAGSADAGTDADAPPPAAKTNQKLVGRIGHLTKTLHQKDEELAGERRRREALEALLNQGADADGAPPPVTTADAPRPGTPEFDRLVDERATQKARTEAFNRDCNTIFDAGLEKHGEAFKDAVTNLNALDMMSPALIEAAMATESPADVIAALGSDVDEAARITALPPIRMAAEIVKLSTKLSAPRGDKGVSRVPPPINPVGGKTVGSQDVYDPDISMEEYERRRAAQGAPYARQR